MDFGSTRLGYRLNGHGDFLNIGTFWCMFECNADDVAWDLAEWLSGVSDVCDLAGDGDSSAVPSAVPPTRVRALRDVLERLSSPFYASSKEGDWGERRKRAREWRQFVSALPEWRTQVDGSQDLEIRRESGWGGLADEYPWAMTVSYHRLGQPGQARSVSAWFVAEPFAVLTREYFRAMEAFARDALNRLSEAPESVNKSELEERLRGLLLV